jgi:hypothetical protein
MKETVTFCNRTVTGSLDQKSAEGHTLGGRFDPAKIGPQ